MTDRLMNSQIVIMRSLFKRGAAVRPVTLDQAWQREHLPVLARRGLIEIWYRQLVGDQVGSRGPFCTLTNIGAQLAQKFLNPAPRGFSGAEKV